MHVAFKLYRFFFFWKTLGGISKKTINLSKTQMGFQIVFYFFGVGRCLSHHASSPRFLYNCGHLYHTMQRQTHKKGLGLQPPLIFFRKKKKKEPKGYKAYLAQPPLKKTIPFPPLQRNFVLSLSVSLPLSILNSTIPKLAEILKSVSGL